MVYPKWLRSFINSHYFSEGLRMTFGIALPAVVLYYFNQLSVGIVVSLGAMCASIADNPGPVHHRKNGMLAATVISTFVSWVTILVQPHALPAGIWIATCCFVLSLISIYGNRANSVGVAGLLIMVLSIDKPLYGWDILWHGFFVLAGGAWYTIMSLSLYRIRPYRLAQQALGDCIQATAAYLEIKAGFYVQGSDHAAIYKRLAEQQVVVHEKQNLIRELLFKSRNIVKESTDTGRQLVMIFLESVDLFERMMTGNIDYEKLFTDHALSVFPAKAHDVIELLVKELENIGIAIKSAESSVSAAGAAEKIEALEKFFIELRDAKRTPQTLEIFIQFRQLLNSIEALGNHIETLHHYSEYNKKTIRSFKRNIEYDRFVMHESVRLKSIRDNLNIHSNIFRHAIRVSIATVAGYIVSLFFSFGHSYWILLTIIVILKPAYSLTRKRNYERLTGTIAGALAGLLILYFIKDSTVLFVIMLLLMVGAYSMLRSRYMLSVLFLTPYIMLLFHLLSPGNFGSIILDRVTDTAIGSGIAYIANIALLPIWESRKIREYMLLALNNNANYFHDASIVFTGQQVSITQFKLSRKNSYVSLANLSDAFTRMLSEPKNKQKASKYIHQFVVLNHMLASHIADLSNMRQKTGLANISEDLVPLIKGLEEKLADAASILEDTLIVAGDTHDAKYNIHNKVSALLEQRQNEINAGLLESETRKTLSAIKPVVDQFNYIGRIATDLQKVCAAIAEEWMTGDETR